jgi:hypothetical protein
MTFPLAKRQDINRCKECGMEYRISSTEDVKMHEKFHQSELEVMKWTKPGTELPIPGYTAVKISKATGGKYWSKVVTIIDRVNQCLGASAFSAREYDECTVFLAVSKHGTIDGVAIVEPCTRAYPVASIESNCNVLFNQEYIRT